MSFLLLVFAVALPTAVAYLIIGLIWSETVPKVDNLILRLSLATGLALGVTSCELFLWRLLIGAPRAGFAVAETVVLVTLLIILLAVTKLKRKPNVPEQSQRNESAERFDKGVKAVFWLAILSAAVVSIIMLVFKPHGTWDAWAIWNMKSSFLFKSGDGWKVMFSPSTGRPHPDYPLCIPGAVARLWCYAKTDAITAPWLTGVLFMFSSLGLLMSALRILKDRRHMFMAGLLVLGSGYFVLYGASQTADIPLGFFILATVVLLALHDGLQEHGYRLAVIAGLSAGLAGWTKNEGLLFIVGIVIARSISVLVYKGWREWTKEAAAFAAGLLPPLVMIVYFKLRLVPPTDYLAAQTGNEILSKLFDAGRYWIILKTYIREFVILANGGAVLLAVYLALAGLFPNGDRKQTIATAGIMLSLMLTGYFFIFVITHNQLEWHLDSFSRLLIPLWPTVVFAGFLAARPSRDRS